MRKTLFAVLALLLAAPLWAAAFSALDRPAARSLASTASHTRPTIVALWSSDCVHCKKNLRLFAEMAKTDKHLRIITIATEPESPEVKRMLDEIALPGERYAYGSEAPEALAFALDPTWRGELPRTFLFDGKGARQAVSGTLDRAAVERGLGIAGRTP